jgi:flavin reductase (DIM6/NTAB) family NADH-FMN oxidoreductase RutF
MWRTSAQGRAGGTIVAVDKVAFRHVAGTFATGVTVITTGRDGAYHAMTANAFMSLSLEPLTVIVSVEKSAHTYPVLEASGAFTVNILAEDQEEVSRLFASKAMQEYHTLRDTDYVVGKNGVPMLPDCLAYVQCTTIERFDGWDHTIFIGEVNEATVSRDIPPLLYFRSSYRRIQP